MESAGHAKKSQQPSTVSRTRVAQNYKSTVSRTIVAQKYERTVSRTRVAQKNERTVSRTRVAQNIESGNASTLKLRLAVNVIWQTKPNTKKGYLNSVYKTNKR
jgi:hypothetical protein